MITHRARPSARRLLLMGPPGVGKGTQAARLSALLGVASVSTGELFRAEVREGTDLGRQVSRQVAEGGYVPDELVNELMRRRLAQPDAANGFLLDGYPRTGDQVKEIDRILGVTGDTLDAVVVLSCDAELLRSRLASRAESEGRADDRTDVISERIRRYDAETGPLAELYEARGLLVRVDGVGAVEVVTERVLAALA